MTSHKCKFAHQITGTSHPVVWTPVETSHRSSCRGCNEPETWLVLRTTRTTALCPLRHSPALNLKHLQPYTQHILVSSVPCTSGPRRSCRKQESRRGRTRPTPGRCNQHCHFFLGFLSPVRVWVGNVCLHISIDIYVYVYIDIDIEI